MGPGGTPPILPGATPGGTPAAQPGLGGPAASKPGIGSNIMKVLLGGGLAGSGGAGVLPSLLPLLMSKMRMFK